MPGSRVTALWGWEQDSAEDGVGLGLLCLDFPLPLLLEHQDIKGLAELWTPQPPVGWGAQAHSPPMAHSRLPALSHAYWSSTEQTPQRSLLFQGDASAPAPIAASPFTSGAAK